MMRYDELLNPFHSLNLSRLNEPISYEKNENPRRDVPWNVPTL